jgi:hypothetical protein
VFVRPAGRRSTGGPVAGSDGGGGDDGAGAGDGSGRGAVRGMAGRITALSSGAITILPAGGAKTTLALTAATTLYRVTPITRAQLRTGAYVATRASLGAGAAASDVVEAAPGTTISIGAAIGGPSPGA